MTLWLILTIMISAAAVLVSAPFIRRLDRRRSDTSSHVAVYRDQLKEVESEAAQGLVDAVQAETVGKEIKRRLLAADHADETTLSALSKGERRFAVVAVSGIVVLGSVGLYALTGSPEPPSAPSSISAQRTRAEPARERSVAENLAAPARSRPSAGQGQAETQADQPPVDEMIQRLVARLQRNPKDTEGWRMLGWSYFNIERFAEAATAYATAIELSPTNAGLRSARAEALIGAANGLVTAEAASVLEDVLKLDPKDARARFFKGLAKEQAGDKAAALKDWKDILRDADPNESWTTDLKQRVADLGEQKGDAISNERATPNAPIGRSLESSKPPGASTAVGSRTRGPGPEDIRNAGAMMLGDRAAMIRGMVDGLASRLEHSPRDADRWIELIRSRIVLGEADMAKKALDRALEIFAGDAPERGRIIAAAQRLGLDP